MKRYSLKHINRKRLALVFINAVILSQCEPQMKTPLEHPIVSQTVKPTQKPIAPITVESVEPTIEPIIEQKREPMLDNEEVTGLAAVGMERSDSGFISGTCADLRVKGLGQFPQGDANYTSKRDRDRNGIACD